jgi:hypothetical protein
MKISVLFLFVASANTFQIQPTRVAQSRTAHKMSWFDFKPIHGAGSGSQRDLEEQYKMQQELVSESSLLYICSIDVRTLFYFWNEAIPNFISQILSIS